MAIVSVADTAGQRGATWSVDKGRTYKQTLRVITDSATDGPRTVMQNLGLRNGDTYQHPLMSSTTEWDDGCFVQGIDVKEEGSDGKQWLVSIDYGPYSAQEQGGASEDGKFDPFKIPPRVRWDDAKFETAVLYDTQTGNPILNTVGDPFDPPLKKDETRPHLAIVRNEPTYDIAWVQQFKDHINSDVFLGFPPNTVKCASITAERQYHADFGYYWEVNYLFEIRPIVLDADGNAINSGWTERVLNAGTREIKSDGSKGPVLLGHAPVSSAVALKKDGTYSATADPYFLEFSIHPIAEFAPLGIPDDLLTQTQNPSPGGS